MDTISPAKGGNIGEVTSTIFGTGFYSGTQVKLTRSGYPDIVVPDDLIQIIHGQQIVATFNLINAATGFYDLVVDVPNDTIMTLSNAFEIEVGIQAEPYSELVGFSSIRVGQYQNYSIVYGNKGNVDAIGVPIWLAVPQNVDVLILDSLSIYHPQDTFFNYDTIPLFVLIDSLGGEPFDAKFYLSLIHISEPTRPY